MTDTSGHVFSAITPPQSLQVPYLAAPPPEPQSRQPGRPLSWLTNILKHLKHWNMSPPCLEAVSNL